MVIVAAVEVEVAVIGAAADKMSDMLVLSNQFQPQASFVNYAVAPVAMTDVSFLRRQIRQ